jgi:hypothetical protein
VSYIAYCSKNSVQQEVEIIAALAETSSRDSPPRLGEAGSISPKEPVPIAAFRSLQQIGGDRRNSAFCTVEQAAAEALVRSLRSSSIRARIVAKSSAAR